MSNTQKTTITLTQKQLQNIMRESCELNKINDDAPICFTVDKGELTISHPPHVRQTTPEEPVNDALGH